MSAIQLETKPMCEPVSLVEAKRYLRVGGDPTQPHPDDDLISTLVVTAREHCENFTRRSFINKGYVQYLDSFPYFVDSAVTQAYPPIVYSSLPRYATTQWNYSQMIKLLFTPLAKVTKITYIGTDQQAHDLLPSTPGQFEGNFVYDSASEPPRIFPLPGGNWPGVLYAPNAVAIHHIAGYNDDAKIAAAVNEWAEAQSPVATDAEKLNYEATLRRADIPKQVVVAMLQLITHWYESREPVNIGNIVNDVPKTVDMLLWNLRVLDLAPTRG